MVLPAVLIVFVLSPAPPASATTAFEEAARNSLSPGAALRVERTDAALSDRTALARAGSIHDIVELAWDAAHDRVRLRCYIGTQRRWVDRDIGFDAGDRDTERGRLVGLAVASMFIDAPNLEPQALGRDVVSADASTGSAPPTAPAMRDLPSERTSSASSRHALEFAGSMSTGIAGNGGGIGASTAILLPLSERLRARVGVGARFGEVPAAQANTRIVVAGLGLLWGVSPLSNAIELDLRADALASWLQVSHLSEDDVVAAHEHAWLFGGDALVTVGYRISTLATVYAGGGMEALLGATRLYTHGNHVATIPALRAVGELGFRTNF